MIFHPHLNDNGRILVYFSIFGEIYMSTISIIMKRDENPSNNCYIIKSFLLYIVHSLFELVRFRSMLHSSFIYCNLYTVNSRVHRQLSYIYIYIYSRDCHCGRRFRCRRPLIESYKVKK
jgi:hypothetical protein